MLTDSHTHLDRFQPEETTPIVQRALNAGVGRIITVGMDRLSSERAVVIAREHASVFACVGCHPWLAEHVVAEDYTIIEELTADIRVIGIGEIGLDELKGLEGNWEKQREVLLRHIQIARSVKMPINVHLRGRGSEAPLLDILRAEWAWEIGGMLHNFDGEWDTAKAALDMGFYISAPRPVAIAPSPTQLQVFAQVPLDRLLLDTDASGTARPLPDGRRLEPTFALEMAQALAALRKLPYASLLEQIEENVVSLFPRIRLAEVRQ